MLFVMMPLKKKIDFTLREIEELDLQNGFFQTLLNLTQVGEIESDYKKAKKILKEIKSWPFYRIFVAVKDDGEILGSTTLLIERKFVHNGGKVGHIEDVATKKEYEGMGIGSALVNRAVEFAKANECYKVILDCSEKNTQFYEKLGFKRHEVSMRYDI